MKLSTKVFLTSATSLIIILLGLSACSGNPKKYVRCDEVVYVDHFKSEAQLKDIDDFSCDEIGLQSVKVVDSLLILSYSSSWDILSLDATHNYGTCLRRGEGPDELLSIPRCGASAFRAMGDSIMACVCDVDRGKLFTLNLTEFMEHGNSQLQLTAEFPKVSNETWEAIPLDFDGIVASMPNVGFTGFSRLVFKSDSVHEPESTKRLNQVTTKSDADINLLAKVTHTHPKGNICVEAMLYLNQINIYSVDGTWAKTLCVGSELDDLAKIEAQFRFNRKDTYMSVSAWEFGFGAVAVNVSELEMQLGKSSNSSIHFFDWDGTPVFCALMPISVKAFDIDCSSGVLYAIDENEDQLKAYDATPVLRAFNIQF